MLPLEKRINRPLRRKTFSRSMTVGTSIISIPLPHLESRPSTSLGFRTAARPV